MIHRAHRHAPPAPARRLAQGFFSVLAAGYVAACALLYHYQRSFLYVPQPATHSTPDNTMMLDVPGATLQITTRASSSDHAVIYFGGNAEDVSASLPPMMGAFPDQALYLLHYRGYGQSTGQPTEEALHDDALSLFDAVHAQHPRITVVGRSLGSGVAVRLASERPVERLVLVTPYNSILELASQQFSYFPVRWLLQDKYESWRYAPQVQAPTLIIAAESDTIIPKASTDALYRHFKPGVATYRTLPSVGHNNVFASPDYVPLLSGCKDCAR